MPTPRPALAVLALVACAVAADCQRPASDSQARTAMQPATQSQVHPRWAVDPMRAGANAPPTGRSLFDLAMARQVDGREVHDLPFPFAALLQRVRERAGCAAERRDCVRVVLFPLGRSLQRMSAAPGFFRHPRVVAAVDGEGDAAGALLLKDRLYLGYQEATGLIEVISYNEQAGRFEFQLVHDYRAGATPKVGYARRMVCATCHQNLAPIFPRAVWQETNANPAIAAALVAAGGDFAGADVHAGVDVPAAIDAATDRANLLGVWQRLWRNGCGADDGAGRRCRAAALLAALQYRLSGERGFDERASGWRRDFLPRFEREWQSRWRDGLAIPNPDLPNRDPSPALAASPMDAAIAHVPAPLEALQPRLPLEVWRLDSGDADPARRLVAGLGGYFPSAWIGALDRFLASADVRARNPRRRYDSPCTLRRGDTGVRFDCAAADGSTRLAGRAVLRSGRVTGGEVDVLALPGGVPLQRLEIGAGVGDADGLGFDVRSRGLAARTTGGAAIERIQLRRFGSAGGEAERGGASIHVVDDSGVLRDAVATLARDGNGPALGDGAFDRSRVMPALAARLGMPSSQATSSLPRPATQDIAPKPQATGLSGDLAPFRSQCAGCHATAERTPANFLYGSAPRVAANLRHCAPRLYARLAMWRRTPSQREKVPMPPPVATPFPTVPQPPHEAAALERIAAGLLRAETGRAPRLDALLAGGYDNLRPCLADG